MKALAPLAILAATILSAAAQAPTYQNILRQVQISNPAVMMDLPVTQKGTKLAGMPIVQGGARFELWTTKTEPATGKITDYLLATKPVGIYPQAAITITSADPYGPIPRVQEGKPFKVTFNVSMLNLRSDASPVETGIQVLRHVQAYPAGGGDENLNRSQATLKTTGTLKKEGDEVFIYAYAGKDIAGAVGQIRGEERFTAFSLPDANAPQMQLASQYIQVWPVTTGIISGVADNQVIKTTMPDVLMTATNVYPSATVYAQIYQGPKVPVGTAKDVSVVTVPVPNTDNKPKNISIPKTEWSDLYDKTSVGSDDRWTLELWTKTPFDPDGVRLQAVTFSLNRSIKVNSTVTTIE